MNGAVLTSTFFAAAIEVIEMVAIVVAVGVARSWRASLLGAVGGLVVLAVLVAALGTALRHVPLQPIRFIVGALLLVFGLQWLRKGVFRVARDGWAVGQGEEDVDDVDLPSGTFDWTAFVLSFKGVSLEGLEVAVIVVAFGAAAHAIGSAIVGAAAAVLLLGLLGAGGYRWGGPPPRPPPPPFLGGVLTPLRPHLFRQGPTGVLPRQGIALLWVSVLYLTASLLLLVQVGRWLAEPARKAELGDPTSER